MCTGHLYVLLGEVCIQALCQFLKIYFIDHTITVVPFFFSPLFTSALYPPPTYLASILAALFMIAKCWKQPKCPSVNDWIKKLWYIYTMEYYEAERKKEFLPFAIAWMDLETIMLSKISQLVKNKYHMISLLRGF